METMRRLQLFEVFLDGQGNNLSSASFHYIAEKISHEMAQMLLVHKTDIETRKEENQTCSYVAASNNSTEVVQLMLGRTKGIKARDGCNEIPLHYAVLHNSAETRRRLLGYNVDMEAWKEKNEQLITRLYGTTAQKWRSSYFNITKTLIPALCSRVKLHQVYTQRPCITVFDCIHPLLRYQHHISVKILSHLSRGTC